MSKNRMVNTRFWDDAYISNLDPLEKLLFLYFLTNTSTNISGIYEIPTKKIAVDTGIDRDMVLKLLKRFEDDGKLFYRDGWLGIVNFVKHQNQGSPLVQKGIEVELKNAPHGIRALVEGKGIDTVSHLTQPNLIKPKTSPKVLKIEERIAFGEFQNVMLSKEEHMKLCERFGRSAINKLIEDCSTYQKSSGTKYRDHYAALLNWARRKGVVENTVTTPVTIAANEKPLSAQDQKKVQDRMKEISSKFKIKT